jgi:hypothetical protein
MDTLEFKINEKEIDGRKIPSTNIFINGKNLIQMLREYELPFATKEGSPNIAGGYAGMHPEDFLYWYLSADWPGDGVHSILTCAGCGEVGCWPMMISATEDDDKVKWSDFHQPHRGPESKATSWDYSDFPSFEFSKENHESEIHKLRSFQASIDNGKKYKFRGGAWIGAQVLMGQPGPLVF